MAVIGTFGSFTTARLGIYASQASLQVTGNNIANINTDGYTRQRADLVSLNSTGTAKYANPMGVDIGYGVLVKSTTQLRDPYLDIRYRNENTTLEYYETMMSGLSKISQTLDEVNKGGTSQNGVIENALQTFKTMLQTLADDVGSEEYDGLVREAAKSLTTFFNTAANNLQTDWDLQKDELNDTVTAVNTCLINIRNLNEQIRKQGLYGDLALELRDARNLYIDELSGYVGINVEYSMERIDQYTEVEKLTITLKDTKDPNNNDLPVKLIDGLYAGQLTIPESFATENPKYEEPPDPADTTQDYYDVNGEFDADKYAEALEAYQNDLEKSSKYVKEYDTDGTTIKAYTNDPDEAIQIPNDKFLPQIEQLVDKKGRLYMDPNTYNKSQTVYLSDTDLYGSVQAMRELLTESGEFATAYDVGNFDFDPNDPTTFGDLTAQEVALLVRAADSNASINKGIPYYQKRLDLLAQKFAEIFNEANQLPASTVYENDGLNFTDSAGNPILGPDGNNAITLDDVTILVDVLDSDGNPVTDDAGAKVQERLPLMDSQSIRAALKNAAPPLSDAEIDEKIANAAKCLEILRDKGVVDKAYGHYDGGVLFSNSGNNNDPTGITASNISIANGWASRVVRVLNRTEPNEVANDGTVIDHSSDNTNILHMITLFEKQLTYSASELEPNAAGGDKTFFHGSFQEMYTDLGATLGSELSTVAGVTYNYEIMTLNMDNNRISISGVDLNDEATSMMQFQKSYQAACRLLTTIDSMLDTLINGTAR